MVLLKFKVNCTKSETRAGKMGQLWLQVMPMTKGDANEGMGVVKKDVGRHRLAIQPTPH